MPVIEGLRATLALVWLVSPPLLVLLTVLTGRRTPHAENSKTRLSLALGSAAVATWILFIVLFIKAQTPYGVIFQTSLLTHGLLLLVMLGSDRIARSIQVEMALIVG